MSDVLRVHETPEMMWPASARVGPGKWGDIVFQLFPFQLLSNVPILLGIRTHGTTHTHENI